MTKGMSQKEKNVTDKRGEEERLNELVKVKNDK
jgi:hypothetical protein